jgi:hypothetical protein
MSGTRRKPGRLEPFVEGYRMWLAESGYMPGTIRNTLKVLGGLGRWMQDRDLEPAELTPAAIAEFRCFCRDHCLRHVPGMRSFECCWTSCDDRGIVGWRAAAARCRMRPRRSAREPVRGGIATMPLSTATPPRIPEAGGKVGKVRSTLRTR